jgi:hypothetical protein
MNENYYQYFPISKTGKLAIRYQNPRQDLSRRKLANCTRRTTRFSSSIYDSAASSFSVRKDLHSPRQPLWVLEPKALVKYLKNREPQLTAEEIALAGFHLSRFIRAEEARRAQDGR